mmetsp:Transcript_14376/g.36748  ORF Transcript_14376/g.36748 Transcript_14376/m.36748 type:complete len:375 (+) Transcript_14376:90-1214(+)
MGPTEVVDVLVEDGSERGVRSAVKVAIDTERRLTARMQAQAVRHECGERKQSAKLLLTGSISGLLGFLFAFLIGLIKSETGDKFDVNGDPYRSGRGYFPATVSEMVHDPSDPAGKVFFCFEFVSALLIFMSWYPTRLRNAYVGDDIKVPVLRMSWTTFRQFIPAPGMMMLSVITTVPFPTADLQDYFCIALHLIGAVMMFVGYFVVEGLTVGWGPWSKGIVRKKLHETRMGIQVRKACLSAIFWTYSLFCIMQVALCFQFPFIPAEEYDQWGYVPNKGVHNIVLLDTAGWPVKMMKILSYGSEVICGLSLIGSHFVIWWYCEERHYDLPEELPHMWHVIRESDSIPEEWRDEWRSSSGEDEDSEQSSEGEQYSS